ncbi:MAG: acetyl-coenzyme A synthetase N-terminal domain-containing protein, partial [SAR324 cluster bacterium]|nr:acetyl-coenzyme A synthetase N-terminal domain-containing protein [SAR324 cluster bacterium]
MSELFEIPQNFKGTAWADDEKYQQMYRQSLENPEAFWAEQAERVDWFKKWDKVLDWNYHEANIRWFEGGQLNVSYNCLDRHLEKKGDQIALIWEG